MFTQASTALLWLFIINLGIAFGVGLYEHRIVAPDWMSDDGSRPHWSAEAARRDDTGQRFWAYVTTGPLTVLTLANLAIAWKTSGPERIWWVVAALTVLMERILTFSYFIPTMVGLMKAPDSTTSVVTATRWMNLGYLRHALMFGGWMGALKAFSLR